MIKNKYNTISLVIVLLFGLGLFFFGTDGFTAFTAESARVNELVKDKPQFPNVTLEDTTGHQYPLTDLEGKYVFITFFYSSCTTVCPQLEMNMAQVYDKVPNQYKGKDIVFLSISFDPERDTIQALDRYKNAFHSDGQNWRMARIPNKAELRKLLNRFGVIVIPDSNGNFTHNTAFYLVDKKGTLVDVLDYKKIDDAAKKLVNILKKEEGE